jgi:hypothetical protein
MAHQTGRSDPRNARRKREGDCLARFLFALLALQTPVSDLVDGGRPRSARLVTCAEGETSEARSFRLDHQLKHHAKASRRWRQVDLEASGERRRVAAFDIAATQLLRRNSLAFIAATGASGDVGSSTARSPQICLKPALAEHNGGCGPTGCSHGLSLAVRGKERSELSLERGELLWSRDALAVVDGVS